MIARTCFPWVSEDGQSRGVAMLGSKPEFGFLTAAGCSRAARKLVVKSGKMLAFVALPLVVLRLHDDATCIPYQVFGCVLSRYFDVGIVLLVSF